MPRALRLLVSVIGLSGAAIIAAAVVALYQQSTQPIVLGLIALAIMVELKRIDLYPAGVAGRGSISLGIGVCIGAIAGFGWAPGVAVATASAVTHAVHARNPWLKATYNIGVTALSALAAGGVLGLAERLAMGDWAVLVGAGLAALAYSLVSTALVALAISLAGRRRWDEIWRENFAWCIPHLVVTGAAGGFLVVAFARHGWPGMVIYLLPVALLRLTYTLYVRRTEASVKALHAARERLESEVAARTRAADQLLVMLSTLIDARDASVYGHSQQVAKYAVALAEELGFQPDGIDLVRKAALLHDIGKIGIPEAILHKPGKLDEHEFEIMKGHAAIGEAVLSRVDALADLAHIVGQHHERWDGKGYPNGLAGLEIHPLARIVAVADALDSMISDRVYSKAKTLQEALREFTRCRGTQFDAQAVDALHALVRKRGEAYFVNSARIATLSVSREAAAASHPALRPLHVTR